MRKEYYEANKKEILDKQRIYKREWDKAHTDYKRKYYLEHKEEIKAKKKIYTENNKELIAKRQAISYRKHIEKRKLWDKEYRAKNKEVIAQRLKNYYGRSKEERRKRNRELKYGLSHNNFLDLLKAQNNRCAICGNTIGENADVDHCHETKKVRGLLCTKCNTGIGLFKDSVENLKKAIEYLS